ncbi:hypothetical protein BC835DRAFT_1398208 [Cytidiella melzeri]|nr:hypothetical protein BC835DRAFT_1398208 [Cytidiella melzeri]
MTMAGLTDFPNELICVLYTYMLAVDVVNLFATCKRMHLFMPEEAVWRHFCASYGVHNPADLGGTTFFQVYSKILHTYGPLMGLWAGDHPYTGSIIEFRVDPERQAIVGEGWDLDAEYETIAQGPPTLPAYVVFMTISLPLSQDQATSEVSQSTTAVISWRTISSETYEEEMWAQTDTDYFPTVHVLSPTTTSTHLQYYQGITEQPLFPKDVTDAWFDSRRGLPRLVVEPSPVAHEDTAVPSPARPTFHLLSLAGNHVRPMAFCIKRAPFYMDEREIAYPWRDIFDVIDDHRNLNTDSSPNGVNCSDGRYYPLRSDSRTGISPDDENWDPASLEGLWLGESHAYVTEVLWVAYCATTKVVSAYKIIANDQCQIPRGVTFWQFDCEDIVRRSDVQTSRTNQHPLRWRRRFRGTGLRTTFLDETSTRIVPIVAIVPGCDSIEIESDEHCLLYRRYPGRNLADEIERSEFRREYKERLDWW